MPYKCPVCEGRGTVPGNFYALSWESSATVLSLNPIPCRTCEGKGLVWAPVDAVARQTVPTPTIRLDTDLPFMSGGGSLAAACGRCGGVLGRCACSQTICQYTTAGHPRVVGN